jgi:hypothetical protein
VISVPTFFIGAQDGCEFESSSFVGARFSVFDGWNGMFFQECNLAYADLSHSDVTNKIIDYCNLFGASNASPNFLRWASRGNLVFTNITSHTNWIKWIRAARFRLGTGESPMKIRSPEFYAWASNQWIASNYTNTPQAWLAWSQTNLPRPNY